MWIREPIFILLWWASTEVQKIVCPSPAGWTEDCACQWSALRWVTAPVDDIVRSDRQCCLHILISIITIITAITIIIVTTPAPTWDMSSWRTIHLQSAFFSSSGPGQRIVFKLKDDLTHWIFTLCIKLISNWGPQSTNKYEHGTPKFQVNKKDRSDSH